MFGGAPAFPTTPRSNFWVHPKGFASGHTWTVGSSLVNNLRFGLTRAALSAQGDNDGIGISFRDVYTPLLNTSTNSRTNPTWNITDDVSWVKGTHTLQFGGNVRVVRNNSVSRANSYDNAQVNFQFYQGGGASLINVVADTLASGFNFDYGRAARNLLLVRDVMHINNLREPQSGQDWYTAARLLNELRVANTPITSVTALPFFERLFPSLAGNYAINGVSTRLTASQAAYRLHARRGVGGVNNTDFTDIQFNIDDEGIFPNAFFHPQYAALQTLSTIGFSNYHGGAFSLRQRFKDSFLLDVNYTLAKAMDNASTLESQRVLSGVIRNPINPDLEYSISNFDIRHNLNANWLIALPFGKGRQWFSGSNKLTDALIGGWQLTGIMRLSSGLPTGTPGDVQWATNWQTPSNGVRLREVFTTNGSNVSGQPNAFSDPLAAYQSFRNARAGEVGDRNLTTLRIPTYFTLDAGLSKSFKLPYAEGHALQFRWEVFNVTNTQPFGVFAVGALSLQPEPFAATAAPPNFGRYSGSQTPVGEPRPGRVMQFALRYSF